MTTEHCPHCGRPMVELSSADGPPHCHGCTGSRELRPGEILCSCGAILPEVVFRESHYAPGHLCMSYRPVEPLPLAKDAQWGDVGYCSHTGLTAHLD